MKGSLEQERNMVLEKTTRLMATSMKGLFQKTADRVQVLINISRQVSDTKATGNKTIKTVMELFNMPMVTNTKEIG